MKSTVVCLYTMTFYMKFFLTQKFILVPSVSYQTFSIVLLIKNISIDSPVWIWKFYKFGGPRLQFAQHIDKPDPNRNTIKSCILAPL